MNKLMTIIPIINWMVRLLLSMENIEKLFIRLITFENFIIG